MINSQIDVFWILVLDIIELIPYAVFWLVIGMLIHIVSDFSSKMGTNKPSMK